MMSELHQQYDQVRRLPISFVIAQITELADSRKSMKQSREKPGDVDMKKLFEQHWGPI